MSQRDVLRLFGRIELKSAGTNGLTGLHGNVDRCRQRRLPRVEVLHLDRIVMFDTCASNDIPSASIQAERPSELIIISLWRFAQHRSSIGGSTTECMRECLVLRSHRGNGVRRGDICALEIVGSEIRDASSNGGGQLGNRLLNLSWVVIRLGLVCLGDPGGELGQIRRICASLTSYLSRVRWA